MNLAIFFAQLILLIGLDAAFLPDDVVGGEFVVVFQSFELDADSALRFLELLEFCLLLEEEAAE